MKVRTYPVIAACILRHRAPKIVGVVKKLVRHTITCHESYSLVVWFSLCMYVLYLDIIFFQGVLGPVPGLIGVMQALEVIKLLLVGHSQKGLKVSNHRECESGICSSTDIRPLLGRQVNFYIYR